MIGGVIDHLVLATPELAATVADLARQGLATSPGGAHDGLGTRNALADLGGGAYLEVVGPDPEQPDPGRPRPFGIDGLRGPRLVAWAVRVDDLDAAIAAARARGHDPGDARDMARVRGDGVRLAALGAADVTVERAPEPALHAVVRTPSGPVELA